MGTAFSPSLSVTLPVAAASASVALTGIGSQVRIVNASGTACFLRLTNGTDSATTSDMLMLGNTVEVFSRGAHTHVAAITAGGATILNITTGEGL